MHACALISAPPTKVAPVLAEVAGSIERGLSLKVSTPEPLTPAPSAPVPMSLDLLPFLPKGLGLHDRKGLVRLDSKQSNTQVRRPRSPDCLVIEERRGGGLHLLLLLLVRLVLGDLRRKEREGVTNRGRVRGLQTQTAQAPNCPNPKPAQTPNLPNPRLPKPQNVHASKGIRREFTPWWFQRWSRQVV